MVIKATKQPQQTTHPTCISTPNNRKEVLTYNSFQRRVIWIFFFFGSVRELEKGGHFFRVFQSNSNPYDSLLWRRETKLNRKGMENVISMNEIFCKWSYFSRLCCQRNRTLIYLRYVVITASTDTGKTAAERAFCLLKTAFTVWRCWNHFTNVRALNDSSI